MSHPQAEMTESEEVASLIAPFPSLRACVGPWLAGFGELGVRRGHNVIWLWSAVAAFPPRRFDHRQRRQRIASLQQFLAEGSADETLP